MICNINYIFFLHTHTHLHIKCLLCMLKYVWVCVYIYFARIICVANRIKKRAVKCVAIGLENCVFCGPYCPSHHHHHYPEHHNYHQDNNYSCIIFCLRLCVSRLGFIYFYLYFFYNETCIYFQ